MLWNWNTVDSCLITPGWQVSTNAEFTAICVGIGAIAFGIQALRRMMGELDAWAIRRQAAEFLSIADGPLPDPASTHDVHLKARYAKALQDNMRGIVLPDEPSPQQKATAQLTAAVRYPQRPGFYFHLASALLTAAICGAGLVLMLLTVYFNGYIFFSIVIGTFLGYALLGRKRLSAHQVPVPPVQRLKNRWRSLRDNVCPAYTQGQVAPVGAANA